MKTSRSEPFNVELCRLMDGAKITCQELADKLGVSISLVRQWRTGRLEPIASPKLIPTQAGIRRYLNSRIHLFDLQKRHREKHSHITAENHRIRQQIRREMTAKKGKNGG